MQGPSTFLTVLANLVIVSGTDEGVFVYNGTPASGNLVASVTGMSGTDSEGNAYLAGVASYTEISAGFWQATVVWDGLFSIYTATSAAGPWSLQNSIGWDATLGAIEVIDDFEVDQDMTVDGAATIFGGVTIGNGTTADVNLDPQMGEIIGYPFSTTFSDANFTTAIAGLNQLIGEMGNRGMIVTLCPLQNVASTGIMAAGDTLAGRYTHIMQPRDSPGSQDERSGNEHRIRYQARL
jgi:hypothetical protein